MISAEKCAGPFVFGKCIERIIKLMGAAIAQWI